MPDALGRDDASKADERAAVENAVEVEHAVAVDAAFAVADDDAAFVERVRRRWAASDTAESAVSGARVRVIPFRVYIS